MTGKAKDIHVREPRFFPSSTFCLILLGILGLVAQPVFSEVRVVIDPTVTTSQLVSEIQRAGLAGGVSRAEATRSLRFDRFDFAAADWVTRRDNRLVADPRPSVTAAPPYSITFAPNGSVRGGGAITFRDVEGHTRVIAIRDDGSIRAE